MSGSLAPGYIEREVVETGLDYDPPSGWRYGFPKPFRPFVHESLVDTLRRDGYPEKDLEFGAQYCRFIGPPEALESLKTEMDW